MVEARRYDSQDEGPWSLAARHRARYDGANQRVVKQVFDAGGQSRSALYVYPGDFERRGLTEGDGTVGPIWEADGDTETQFLVGGARLVATNLSLGLNLDPDRRLTIAIPNLIQSTSAVIDLRTGELLEVGGFYPNGAREEWLGASDELGGATMPQGLWPCGWQDERAGHGNEWPTPGRFIAWRRSS